MIGYKLFRERKDGSLGPLFINRRLKIKLGTTYKMEEHRTKGFAFRPGWHICKTPNAPHLSIKDRAWYKVEFELLDTIVRPESQGGIWYLGKNMTVLERL
jgi:hypothetical protein